VLRFLEQHAPAGSGLRQAVRRLRVKLHPDDFTLPELTPEEEAALGWWEDNRVDDDYARYGHPR
jgi:hypothetical protein